MGLFVDLSDDLASASSAAAIPGNGATASPAETLARVFRSMLAARCIDEMESELVARGEAFFHLSAAGHESSAALQPYLIPEDWLHLHYRDRALVLARGVPPIAYFHNLLCNRESQSAGRQMSPFISDPERRLLSQNVPVGNHALQAVGVAHQIVRSPERSIVVCTMGDGSTQQGEVFEAISEAVRAELPVLFVIEDNGYSISTPTARQTFFSLPGRYLTPDRFLGLPIHRFEARDVSALLPRLGAVVKQVRRERTPGLVVLKMARLADHTNADDHRVYRDAKEIEAAWNTWDPVKILRERLVELGLNRRQLLHLEEQTRDEVHRAAETALLTPDPEPVFSAKAEPVVELEPPLSFSITNHQCGPTQESAPRLTMVEALRGVLRLRLESDPSVVLLGEDIEDPKGDVFGVTRGLSTQFPDRVLNTALSEATILGVAIGRALAGARPVAFIQFADFLPQAFNQIVSELGSMHWRSAGAWNCPVIVLVACGGYRPGLGPFHSQTMESIMAHVPGIDVFMPSTAADAAGLLQSAFQSDRPTIFFYPKIALNDPDHTTTADLHIQRTPAGVADKRRSGTDLTIVSWGHPVRLCEQVVQTLEPLGLSVDLLDLRSISPWDVTAVVESARTTKRLLVVHEDNITCGFGAEVVATVVEKVGPGVKCRRVARPDTLVPCNFANQLRILPSFRGILTAAAELLDLDLSWDCSAETGGDGRMVLEAPAPSPADRSITVLEWSVQPGDCVSAGQKLGEIEASKAVSPLLSPVAAEIEELLVTVGEPVLVGAPMIRLKLEGRTIARRVVTRENPGTPRLQHKRRVEAVARRPQRAPDAAELSDRSINGGRALAGISGLSYRLGGLAVSNEELVLAFPPRKPLEILRRTGIETRRRLAPGQSIVDLAIEAARESLDQEGITLHDLDAVICATTTPRVISPSMACLIVNGLCDGERPPSIPAYDLNAACAGYLYALTSAFDLSRSLRSARVLVVTAEAMSLVIDPHDFQTAILFGDAATATLVHGPDQLDKAQYLMHRPVIASHAEDGRLLTVPPVGTGETVKMNGLRVFEEAAAIMLDMVDQACLASGLTREDLDRIVPHQANGRIIEEIRMRLGPLGNRLVNSIRHVGNTSSSSIPLCLAGLEPLPRPGDRLALTAFGGGFAFGGAILEVPAQTSN